MSRAKRYHYKELPGLLSKYAESRTLEYHRYSEYHLRLIDDGFTVVDIWTTGKYWVKESNYFQQTDKKIIERGGEKGDLPVNGKLTEYLDGIFYAADLIDQEASL